ncbi:hypothetical protein GCM10010358_81970 [Streptomyces minutiscleroticus]|uniref:Uncharacterized protein n=1 Tax=Streptomyces minutiscleroticus TaxID=68238 RepID=A0A918P518_9ACTN|nr:hypothetical protein [Streptomyces minutiscleroticus]GGY18323.1 hypothetical protein GCM10010358_81970 [Streptomyces minutiscleroticus]
MSGCDEDGEILAPRHRITLLERRPGAGRVRFAPADRAFLAAQLVPLPRRVLRGLRLLVGPDTVVRWHRDVMKRRQARTRRSKKPGRPTAIRSMRTAMRVRGACSIV